MRAWRNLILAVTAAAIVGSLASWAVPTRYLPPSNKVKGWLWRKQPTTYSPKTLYNYIDGAADLYLAYGFREAAVVEFYRGKSDAIMLDVYDMGRPLHAFGIFNSEKPAGAKGTGIGAQSYASSNLAAFWKGPFYVKLSVVDGKGEALSALARAADMYLPASAELPVELRRLPAQHRVRDSEAYVRKDALGHQFLVETISADYQLGKAIATLYLSDLAVPVRATQAWGKLRDFEAENGSEVVEVSGLQEQAFAAKDSSLGQLVASHQGRFVIIAVSQKASQAELTDLVKQVVLIREVGRGRPLPGNRPARAPARPPGNP